MQAMPDTVSSQAIATYLGFDFGLKRIGVAVGQTLTRSATALKIVPANNGLPRWEDIDLLINEWQPQGLVVGLPLNIDGSDMPVTEDAKRFVRRLKGRYNLPVQMCDERLTTKAAKERMYANKQALKRVAVDAVAAELILQQWLGQNNNAISAETDISS